MKLSYHLVSVTATNSVVTLARPCHSVTVTHYGDDPVFVNFQNAGVAAVTGNANVRMVSGETIKFTSEAKDILLVGVICDTGDTASVRFIGAVND